MARVVAGVTFPLIFVGGLVTTTQAGMAVPDWPTTYGYNMFLYPWTTWLFGPWDLFVEHGHRLLASLVGLLTIALVVVCFLRESRRWVKALSLMTLAAVIGQGILGGMRVVLDERTLAQLHACIGPAFFALAVALSVFCSPTWTQATRPEHPSAAKLQGLSLFTLLVAYLQIVFGSFLRHVGVDMPHDLLRAMLWMHVLTAAVLVCDLCCVFAFVRKHFADQPALRKPARWLVVLVGLQIALGLGTWFVKYNWPAILGSPDAVAGYTVAAQSFQQSLIVTAHVAIGSLILVTSLTLALRSLRLVKATRPVPVTSSLWGVPA